jgi:hypothetical protein
MSAAIHFNDDRWTRLLGGYRLPYDPRPALRALERGEAAEAWNELWNKLRHQGDIGDAAYAAVPHIVRIHELRGVPDWNTYALVATIELLRDDARNPKLPTDLQEPYDAAWRRLVEIGLFKLKLAKEAPLVTSILAVLAIGKGQRTLGCLAAEFTEDERQEMLAKAGGASANQPTR